MCLCCCCGVCCLRKPPPHATSKPRVGGTHTAREKKRGDEPCRRAARRCRCRSRSPARRPPSLHPPPQPFALVVAASPAATASPTGTAAPPAAATGDGAAHLCLRGRRGSEHGRGAAAAAAGPRGRLVGWQRVGRHPCNRGSRRRRLAERPRGQRRGVARQRRADSKGPPRAGTPDVQPSPWATQRWWEQSHLPLHARYASASAAHPPSPLYALLRARRAGLRPASVAAAGRRRRRRTPRSLLLPTPFAECVSGRFCVAAAAVAEGGHACVACVLRPSARLRRVAACFSGAAPALRPPFPAAAPRVVGAQLTPFSMTSHRSVLYSPTLSLTAHAPSQNLSSNNTHAPFHFPTPPSSSLFPLSVSWRSSAVKLSLSSKGERGVDL